MFLYFGQIAPPLSTITLLIVFLLTTALSINDLSAQTASAFTIVSAYNEMDADQTKVINSAVNMPHLGNLQYIKWSNSTLVGTDGKIRITIPSENNGQEIQFDLLGSIFTNENEYFIAGKNNEGDVSISVSQLGKIATINFGSSQYKVFPLGDVKGVMIKSDPSGIQNSCDNADILDAQNVLGFCDTDCGTSILDVLYMVTPGAQAWYENHFGIFWPLFLVSIGNEFNMGLMNSQVPNKRARFKPIIYTPAFQLGQGDNKLANDCGKLNDPVNGQPSDAEITLKQNGADVGILLVNLNLNQEGHGYGYATSNSLTATADYARFSCIQASGIYEYTQAHELAHQIGCTHGTDAGGPVSGCPNGKYLPINKRNTILAKGNAFRIPYFSNPSVFYNNESTGEVGIRNNAAQLRGAFCEVASMNNPAYYGVHYDYFPEVRMGCPFSASATVESGLIEIPGTNIYNNAIGPYSYEWSWATDLLGPFIQIGSNSPNLELSSPPSCPMFFLRLKVTSANGFQANHYQLIQCQPNNPSKPCTRSAELDNDNQRHYTSYQAIPNPAQDKVSIALEDFSSISSIAAISISGKVVTELKSQSFENGQLICDISSLPSGLWLLKVKNPEKSATIKLAILR